jgi:hypothetical protein
MIESMTFLGGRRDGEPHRIRIPDGRKPNRVRIDGVIYYVRQAKVGLGRVLVAEEAIRLYEKPPV